jgi:hypothetical protein
MQPPTQAVVSYEQFVFGHLFFTNIALINAKILFGMITNGASLENFFTSKKLMLPR